jgi:hypothetical protein
MHMDQECCRQWFAVQDRERTPKEGELHRIHGMISNHGPFCFSLTLNSPTCEHTLNAGHLRVQLRLELELELGPHRMVDTLDPCFET